jgi:hypothetical protein
LRRHDSPQPLGILGHKKSPKILPDSTAALTDPSRTPRRAGDGVEIATEKKTTNFRMTVVQEFSRKRRFPRTAKLLRRDREFPWGLDSR